jgi:hypothetical protein
MGSGVIYALLALLVLLGIPAWWAMRYLMHVRHRRQWWLAHPEAREARRARIDA